MHIAIIAPEQIPVPPKLGGSVEICIWAIARELSKRHTITIFSRAARGYPRHSILKGVQIYRIPSRSKFEYISNVIRLLRQHRFDLIQIDNRPSFVSRVKSQFPQTTVSLFMHSLTYVSKPYTNKTVADTGLAKTDLIIANSASLKYQLTKRFHSAANKIFVIRLGVDTARFRPAKLKKNSTIFRVLFAGRLIPRKGLSKLMQAVHQIRKKATRPIKIIVAGGSLKKSYTLKLRNLARKLSLNISFLGTIPHHKIHRIFRNADLFVCPSQKHEAFGLVNVEAMASGLPVIASGIGGIKEIVQTGYNGILIKDYKNANEFGKAILKLMNDKDGFTQMQANARSTAVQQFSWRMTAHLLEELYLASTRTEEITVTAE